MVKTYRNRTLDAAAAITSLAYGQRCVLTDSVTAAFRVHAGSEKGRSWIQQPYLKLMSKYS
jgi:hypothetical protein